MKGLKNAIGIIYSPTGDLGLNGCSIKAQQASDVHKGIKIYKLSKTSRKTYIMLL